MKKWAFSGAVVILLVASGATWAVALRDDGSQPPRDLATLIAGLGDSPAQGEELAWDRCFEVTPALTGDGALAPQLAAFPARLLGPEFELISLQFGHLCYGGSRPAMLETQWRQRSTGVKLLIDQSEASAMPNRIADGYATFHDGNYDFYLLNLSLMDLNSGRPDRPAIQRALESGLEQLHPPVALRCFYRNGVRDWSDLAALGVGDPRPQLPAGYAATTPQFTVLEHPADGCPAGGAPPAEEPPIEFQAMLAGPGGSLFAIQFHSLMAGAIPPDTFQPGRAVWHSDRYVFDINWAPERMTEDQVRAVARALDPGFESVCSLSARPVDFAGLNAADLREPGLPAGAAGNVTGTFLVIGPSPACDDRSATGFMARWTMEVQNPFGIIEVSALFGTQLANTRPFYAEGRTLYWKRGDGTEFFVIGYKADFSHEQLLAAAESVDPAFEPSLLAVPQP
jgi:hypothetical protein